MATVTVVVTVLALVVAASLVVLTTTLHRAVGSGTAALESARLAQRAQIDLLLHERAQDPLVKRDIQGDLRRRLTEARRHVTTEEEERLLAHAVMQVDTYVESTRDTRPTGETIARQDAAYVALESLVAVNVEQAKASQRDAKRWDNLGNLLGMGVGALLIVVAGGVIIWLRKRAFQPVLGLAAAMERFGRGDRGARAVESGAKELRDMSAQFNQMASAISAQREAQMTFLGGIAHDLRNPLSALQLSVSLLGSEQHAPSEPRLRQAIARIARQITRMDRMLGDFLDLAKIEAGELDLRMEIHDARALVREVVELMEDVSSGHRIIVRVPDGGALLRCDSLRVEQVITNVISNAIKYSPPGTDIEVELEARREQIVLTVTDHGAGIAEDDRARIFEPFRRVGPSRESAPGIGLGLFVVKRIVEAHGGRIDLDSVLGAGSTFRIVLPRETNGDGSRRQRSAPLLTH